MANRIYLSAPHVTDADMQAVQQSMASGWVSTVGPAQQQFEADLATYAGGGAVVALSSGTAAIHLGLQLLGVGPGDLVVVPSLTFAASLNPILYLGATPVLADVELETGNLCPESLQQVLVALANSGKKAKAIIVVHLYGKAANMGAIMALAAHYGCAVLEDAAEAMGSTHEGKPLGTLGHVGVWSFNGNKIMTTSGGGALWCPTKAGAEKVRAWASQAREPVLWYQHQELGYNYRLSNLLAALGSSQLLRLHELVIHRQRIAEAYQALLAPHGILPYYPNGYHNTSHNCWLPVFKLPFDEVNGRQMAPVAVCEALSKRGIEARPVWKPMHQQPYQSQHHLPVLPGFPISDAWFSTGICLPSGPMVSMEVVGIVVAELLACTCLGGPSA